MAMCAPYLQCRSEPNKLDLGGTGPSPPKKKNMGRAKLATCLHISASYFILHVQWYVPLLLHWIFLPVPVFLSMNLYMLGAGDHAGTQEF